MTRPGPFPGMDPWLERSWRDVHASLAVYARDQLNERLQPGLVARAQERVYIEFPASGRRQVSPDVHVYEPKESRPGAPQMLPGGTVLAEPDRIHLSASEVREPFVEIRDAQDGGRVVTVIEFVSPTNKGTKVGRRKYLQKQREVVDSEANLVEVDLLRGGRGVTLAAGEVTPVERRSAYHVCVRRASAPSLLDYYAIPLRERLPAIRVPLRPSDSDVPLDLQALVDTAYEKGRYSDTIDYSKPPIPSLQAADAEWARGLIAQWREAHVRRT